ncbi:gamma-glutamylcyclotransferase [Deltaproteobacteria bacterium]|nr:gamma-glutamylcyclotransferase [Deltaproteobacteria bacterium]
MKCGRCGYDTSVTQMSLFNTDDLCPRCEQEERYHPDYHYAKIIEYAATKAGNLNFPGVGWPGVDGRVQHTPDGVERT